MEEQIKQKNSGLGITGMIMAIIPCTSFIGLILSIIDVCKKDDKKKTCAIIGIVISGLYILVSLTSLIGTGGNGRTTEENNISTEVKNIETEENKNEEQTETEEKIEYIECLASQLMKDLNENAMRAQSTYKGEFVEITGKLSTIDASGKYISLEPENGDFTFITSIICYTQDDSQKEKIMEISRGDIITIKGKITEVGEVMGYSIDIDEIK